MMIEQNIPDPYNLIITGVGGQGNVMASRVIGNMLSQQGYYITIGETFGASQRGGSVMSHLRISKKSTFSPQIAKGQAHMVVALEPTEALRVLANYGSEQVKVLSNTRPVYSVGVIAGEQTYPKLDQIKEWIGELSQQAWYINATDQAMETMNNPIFGNIILLGALSAISSLPLSREHFRTIISQTLSTEMTHLNLNAFDMGTTLMGEQTGGCNV